MSDISVEISRRISPADVETALAEVQANCSPETAAPLRAVFDGFSSLAQMIGAGVELAHGTDRVGVPHLYLVIKF